MFKRLALGALALSMASCTLYESEGRKFLRDQALPSAGLAFRQKEACLSRTPPEHLSEAIGGPTPWRYLETRYPSGVESFGDSSNRQIGVLDPNGLRWCEFHYSDTNELTALYEQDLALAIDWFSTFGQDR